MESARLIANSTLFFVQAIERIIEAISKFRKEYDAASLEEFIRGEMMALGAVVFEYCWALRCREQGRPKSLECPCGRRRVFKGRAERALRTTMGEMDLTERFRYRCPACGGETIPGDELRGEGRFSELAERLIAYAGQAVGGMFEQAQKTVRRLLGMDVTGKTIQSVCLRRGRRAMAEKLGTPPKGADESDPRVVLWRNVGYFEENARRMKYDECRKKGIPMASGVVESACKHVVASRLKGPGMRWDEEGAEAILHLRCLELNGRWDAFWEKNRAA